MVQIHSSGGYIEGRSKKWNPGMLISDFYVQGIILRMYWNERSIMLRKLFVQVIVQSLSLYVYNFIRHTKRWV